MKKTTILLIFFTIFINIVVCYASTETSAHHNEISWTSFFWSVVNFLLLVIILFIFGRKPVMNYLTTRKIEIETSLNEAKEAHRKAAQSLTELELRLKDKDKEIAELLEAAQKAGERERDMAIEEGKRRKANILEQTQTQLEYEFKKAKDAIKTEVVHAAIERAEKELIKNLSNKEKEKLLQSSLRKMQSRN
jgi:F-type H+-transporting ATPase subunit b